MDPTTRSYNIFTADKIQLDSLQRGLRHLGATSGILVTLLLRSYEQSERVAAAMRLRGFSGSFHSLARFRSTAADLLAAFLTGIWICLLLWLELR